MYDNIVTHNKTDVNTIKEEKRTELQNLTKRNVTYEELAPILGVGTANALRNWNYRKRPLKEFEIKKIDEAFNISSTELNTISSDTDSVTIDYYPDVFGSCGNGVFVTSEHKEQIQVPINAYINVLKKSGSAKQIIKDYKQSKANNKAMLESVKHNLESLEYARQNAWKVPDGFFESIRNQIQKSPIPEQIRG